MYTFIQKRKRLVAAVAGAVAVVPVAIAVALAIATVAVAVLAGAVDIAVAFNEATEAQNGALEAKPKQGQTRGQKTSKKRTQSQTKF